ncbi:hypothetical protein Pmani_035760 [Petrolisthes manimaculis]|uniref:Cytosolic endo-beta-N-acetylglucosaminidase n=1 Tax=Petrolisthes manimaculis TaxID=1843537 RepID=A0AAE1TQ62_9EUCA|nr:hypothetical protein Pmani_035760 [Petrolisthes manimaculis]
MEGGVCNVCRNIHSPPVRPPTDPTREIQPLKTWDEFVKWQEPETALHPAVVEVTRLMPRSPSLSASTLRTLLCHDMKGGYIDDRFYEGNSNVNAYRFYHWSGIDTFVYFSHHSVTIPPPAWINAAHSHGVKVLGTLITECGNTEAFCDTLLTNEESVSMGVSQLIAIAKYHGFEGWLINIENIVQPNKVELLIDFVKQLRKGMKKVCEEAEVLWYDSVTVEGKLEWQNELNELNRAFYEASDGIFLNYTWTDRHLEKSWKEAGGKEGAGKVYVGIDVFGRNFYEGGKFNTWKALEKIRSYGLSAAIFAPGWTHECDTGLSFEDSEAKMWSDLHPFLTYHGPGQLPVATSFCQGYGHAIYDEGKMVKNGKWHNLSKQRLQPILWQEGRGVKLNLVTSDAYKGGGSLGIVVMIPKEIRLFVCGLKWKESLLVSVWYKWEGPVVPFTLYLNLHSTTNTSLPIRTVELRCDGFVEARKEGDQPSKDNEVESNQTSKKTDQLNKTVDVKRKTEEGKHDVVQTKKKRTSKCDVSLVVSREENGWTRRSFTVGEEEGWEVCEIGVRLSAPSILLLGYITLDNFTPTSSDYHPGEVANLLRSNVTQL